MSKDKRYQIEEKECMDDCAPIGTKDYWVIDSFTRGEFSTGFVCLCESLDHAELVANALNA